LFDGEPQLVRALRINLLARQYDVVVAAGGAEALRLAADCRPDLVVLDLGRPDLDGVDVIRQLRAWSPVPILVLSGRADFRDKVEALDAGADVPQADPLPAAVRQPAAPQAGARPGASSSSAHRAQEGVQPAAVAHPGEWLLPG
jgi:two-component system KDP operon response regulator KdpE